MKKSLLFSFIIGLSISLLSQVNLLTDDFVDANNWTLTGNWGITTLNYANGISSISESPFGLYQNMESTTATLTNPIDLSAYSDCSVSFYAWYNIELGFDFMYFEASADNGQSWNVIHSFNGIDTLWNKYTFWISGYAGNSDVKIRFRWESDQGFVEEGMFIDYMQIIAYPFDASPPFIIHEPSPHYEGELFENYIVAEILDISGVSSTNLYYSVDGINQLPVSGVPLVNNEFLYEIPTQSAGSFIDYYISASDGTNIAYSDTFTIIAGNYMKYDNGQVDFVTSIGYGTMSVSNKAAVRFTLNGSADLKTALIRTYTDVNRPNDSITVHVWGTDSIGQPGADLINPVKMWPAATLEIPHKITVLDLRPFSSSLTGISGDVWVGFEIDTMPGEIYINQTTPGIGGRSYVLGSLFNPNAWSSVNDDYHFRMITGQISGAPVAGFNTTNLNDPVIDFTDISSGNPNSWSWDFGDGFSSTDQNPTHVFPSNDNYNVCLTASNNAGTHTKCQAVTITSCVVPTADFVFDTVNDPIIQFTDSSVGYPTYWEWDFGDGTVSFDQNPEHYFSTNGTYNVQLIASNGVGADTVYYSVNVISNAPPSSSFFVDSSSSPIFYFYDISLHYPLSWVWDFGDGYNSYDINPTHIFEQNGVYPVCLTVTNAYGSNTFCDTIVVDVYTPPVAYFSMNTSYPPWVYFTDLSSDSIINAPDSYYWTFGDGGISIYSDPSHFYSSNDTFVVCMNVLNSEGSDVYCDTLIMDWYLPPTAGFYYTNYNTPTINFHDTSSTDVQNLTTSWYWEFGDGDTSSFQNPNHQYLSNGTYYITLTAYNDEGMSQAFDTVDISAYVQPSANFTKDVSMCPEVHFTDLSQGIPIAWHWDFGDGNTDSVQNPVHIYEANGIYDVCLKVSNSEGADSICVINSVTVNCYTVPIAQFDWDDTNSPSIEFIELCSDSIINATELWFWDFDDGDTSILENPIHTFKENGLYHVCLEATNFMGTTTICHDITISDYGIPEANFNFLGTTPPLIKFFDLSTGTISNWQWDFGDGYVDTIQNPEHSFEKNGEFAVCLSVDNYLGTDTFCDTVIISVHPSPVSDFSYMIDADSLINFFDESTNSPDSWKWYFGDDSVSFAQNPKHRYDTTGVYSVCLVTGNFYGNDSICKDIEVIYTSIQNDFIGKIRVYPNPANRELYILNNSKQIIEEIELFNSTGQLVHCDYEKTRDGYIIRRNSLASGVYALKLHLNNKKSENRIIVFE